MVDVWVLGQLGDPTLGNRFFRKSFALAVQEIKAKNKPMLSSQISLKKEGDEEAPDTEGEQDHYEELDEDMEEESMEDDGEISEEEPPKSNTKANGFFANMNTANI